jgi:hypothetical protein
VIRFDHIVPVLTTADLDCAFVLSGFPRQVSERV